MKKALKLVFYLGEFKGTMLEQENMKTRSFTVIFYKEEDMYIAECLEVGTIDQGATIEEAITNLKAATKLYL